MRPRSIEWPTIVVAGAVMALLGATLLWHEHLPTALLLAALAVVGAWYNSLQHEVVHGHPTRWHMGNTALAIIPFGLVVPFSAYRASHLAHHRTELLTDPSADPESFYVTVATWERAGRLKRAALLGLRTLSGRIVFGPVVSAVQWWGHSLGALRSAAAVRSLGAHVAGVAAVLVLVRSAGMPLWIYVVGVAWGGGALTMLRSFAEHKHSDAGTRSAVVQSNWFFSLLFLNNNLHHTHHAMPQLPWYQLPAAHARLDANETAASGAGLYAGYAEIARRHLVRPFDVPVPSSVPLGQQ